MIRMQIKTMVRKKEFKLTLLGCTIMAVLFFIKSLVSNPYHYDKNFLYCGMGFSECWSIFSVLFPFLVVIPFATSFIDDLSDHTFAAVLVRGKIGQYLFAKFFATFMGNFMVVFFPFLINLILCNLFIPATGQTPFGHVTSSDFVHVLHGTNHLYQSFSPKIPFLSIYERSPLMYNFVYLLILSGTSGMLGVLVLSISLWIRKYKIVLFLPVYLLVRLGQVFQTFSFERAMGNPDKYFTNWSMIDYIAPFSFSGKYYPFFILFMILIAVNAVFSCWILCKKEYFNV